MPTTIECGRARAAEDPRFDGLFFTAIRSTRIYCRPVCPAPKQCNVQYFPTAAAAATAGYRPCLRCRPELSPGVRWGGEDAVQCGLTLIADGALEEGSVGALAKKVGVSERHLRRLFLQHSGATPIAVHTTRRLLLAKQLLTETALPVTQVAIASGFQSARRFNAAFAEGCGMAPTAIRRSRADTPRGVLKLRLAYRPPLDFYLMLSFFAKRVMPGIELVNTDRYERVLGPADATTWIRVSQNGSKPERILEFANADPGSIPHIVRRVRRLFDLDANLAAVHSVMSAEPMFASGIERWPGLRVPGAWTAHYVAMRALSHPDAFPAGDLVLQQVLGMGKRLGLRETGARSQSWRPWRAYAVLHLWHLSCETVQGVSHVV